MSDQSSELNDLQKFRRDIAVRDLEKIYDVILDLFKWGLTTSLALNGAALVALVSSNELRPLISSVPGVLFGLGTISAFGAGITIILGLTHLGNELINALWRGDGLELDSFEEFAPDKDSRCALKVGGLFLLFSLTLFVAGCVYAGVSTADVKSSNSPSQTEAKK